MKDERLNDLSVLACEKDLTDNIDLNAVLRTWAGVEAGKTNQNEDIHVQAVDVQISKSKSSD